MYFFYIDESGNRDPKILGIRRDGSTFDKDHLFVLLGVSLFEHKWLKFENSINEMKISLMNEVSRQVNEEFDLSDLEIHSSVIRRPSERAKSKFFRHLSVMQITNLTNLFYQQLNTKNMHLFAVVIDKRYLANYMDEKKLQRKAYELLLERIQNFMGEFHSKHLGVIVADDMSRQMNRSMALKHSFFLREGTTSNLQLCNIVEMPFFVESALSNGVQLADLCAYNVYRAFRYENFDYEYFQKILPFFYNSRRTETNKIDGLKVFPDNSPLCSTELIVGRQ